MVAESVEFLKAAGLRVFFDAEHFFDGYKVDPEFTLRVLEAAATNGADCVVLCDTNGGSLPHEVAAHHRARSTAYLGADQQLGIHTQNDTGCAAANATAAVLGGVTQLQGTVNGYGERTGNANLMTCIPNLELKMGVRCLPEGRLERLTAVSRHVAELVNLPPHSADPYVGMSAFAHKGGLHTSALGQGGRGHLRAHRARAGRQRHPRAGERPRGPGRDGDEGQGAGRRPRRPGGREAVRRAQAAGVRRLRVRGGRRQPRAADAPGHRLGADLLLRGGLPRHHLPPGPGAGLRPARHRHRGHREDLGGRRAAHRGGRGQRPGQRPRPGPAPAARRAPTRSSPTSTSPTTGCASSTPKRTPTRWCAC